MPTISPLTSFPASGLPSQNRYIVGHNDEGKSVFLVSDKGDHSATMVEGAAAQNIPYSTSSNPVDFANDQDIKFAQENKVFRNFFKFLIACLHASFSRQFMLV